MRSKRARGRESAIPDDAKKKGVKVSEVEAHHNNTRRKLRESSFTGAGDKERVVK